MFYFPLAWLYTAPLLEPDLRNRVCLLSFKMFSYRRQWGMVAVTWSQFRCLQNSHCDAFTDLTDDPCATVWQWRGQIWRITPLWLLLRSNRHVLSSIVKCSLQGVRRQRLMIHVSAPQCELKALVKDSYEPLELCCLCWPLRWVSELSALEVCFSWMQLSGDCGGLL